MHEVGGASATSVYTEVRPAHSIYLDWLAGGGGGGVHRRGGEQLKSGNSLGWLELQHEGRRRRLLGFGAEAYVGAHNLGLLLTQVAKHISDKPQI